MTPATRKHTKWVKRTLFNRYIIAVAVLLLGGLAYATIYHFFFNGFEKPTGVGKISDYSSVVNGLIGTSVTVLGVAFVAYAYRDQQRQAEFALFTKLYEDLLTDINSIQYRKRSRGGLFSRGENELFTGVDALYNYAADDGRNPNSVLNHLNLILVSFEHILELLDGTVYQDRRFEGIMKDKLYLLFFSKIYWPCFALHERYRDQLLRDNWGNAPVLFFKFERFTQQTYHYLLARKLVALGTPTRSLATILATPYTDWEQHWLQHPPRQVPTSRLATCVMAVLDSWPVLPVRQLYAYLRR